MSVKPAAVTRLNGDDENVRGCKKQQNPSKMYIIGREICFIFAILFTTYAAVLNTNHTNSKGPPPAPFFRKGSLVTDYYSGELRTMLKKVSEVELMFIMYYAPWDAESQSLRKEFEVAAEHHHKQVFFAAINCWQPGSECRAQASKIPILTYPEFIAYPLQGSPIGYEGQRLAGHMIKFVNTLLHPIHRIENPDELKNLKIRYDAVVVGCVEFKNMRGGIEYKAIHEAALKLPERNTKDVGFAIVTNPIAAARIGLKTIPSVSLHLWNEIREYSGVWKGEALSQWISQNIDAVVSWISPPGVKSLTFKPFVDVGSVLIMFTPENPLLSHTKTYDMLREIGLLYHDCKNNSILQDFVHFFSTERLKMNAKEDSVHDTCQRRRKNIATAKANFDIPVQIVENVWINTSASGLKSRKRTHPVSSWSDGVSSSWSNYAVPTCRASVATAKPDSSSGLTKNKPVSSMLISDQDYRSASSLISWKFIEKCQQYFRASSFGIPSFHLHSEVIPIEPISDFVGLRCRSNRTLSFLAMDSNIYEHFADGLGIDLNEYTDKTAVLIFNAEVETVYLMDKLVTVRNLQEFVLNYTKGRVERHLRSEPRSSIPPNRYQPHVVNKSDGSKPSVALLELTSHTFRTVALNESQNVVVFHHSPFCAFCHGVSHVYLTVAHLLRNISNLVFARIDGENNDLPWEFTVHHYPSILFLPAYRKSESRVFSQRLPITVDNLSKFVLANLNAETRLQGMIELCSRWSSKQFQEKQSECILSARHMCLNMIAEALKEYRTLSRQIIHPKFRHKTLQRLLKRLQYLKEVHLQLGALKISSASDLISEYHSKVFVNVEETIHKDYNNNYYNSNNLVKDEL